MHQLPLHPCFASAEISAGESATELCYDCHCRCSLAILHALQAPCQRRRDDVQRLPQPARLFPPTWGMASGSAMVKRRSATKKLASNAMRKNAGHLFMSILRCAWKAARCAIIRTGRRIRGCCRRPVVFTMCLECHNGAPGFGRTGQGAPVPPQFHDLRSPHLSELHQLP